MWHSVRAENDKILAKLKWRRTQYKHNLVVFGGEPSDVDEEKGMCLSKKVVYIQGHHSCTLVFQLSPKKYLMMIQHGYNKSAIYVIYGNLTETDMLKNPNALINFASQPWFVNLYYLIYVTLYCSIKLIISSVLLKAIITKMSYFTILWFGQ